MNSKNKREFLYALVILGALVAAYELFRYLAVEQKPQYIPVEPTLESETLEKPVPEKIKTH